jgi:hypothetical protein
MAKKVGCKPGYKKVDGICKKSTQHEFKTTEISKEKWNERKQHGYASVSSGISGIPKGTKMILEMDKKTGGTILVPVHIRSPLDIKLKRRFSSYDNQALIDRANRDYASGKNTDDVEYELSRRRRDGKINYKASYDSLVLIK